MSTLIYITQGTSPVYHISLDGKTAICKKHIYNATNTTNEISKKQYPCKRCMKKIANMISAKRKKYSNENSNRLISIANDRNPLFFDKENQVMLFSDFPSLSKNVISWLSDYHKKKPHKYINLLCVDHDRPFRATLYYKGSTKKYDILLPGRKEYYNSAVWRNLSQRVFSRDNHTCRLCGSTTDNFTAHHITYERFGCEKLEDLTTLCRICHSNFHITGGKLRR